MIRYSIYRQLKSQDYIDCSYFKFAFVIPIKILIEDLVWKVFKRNISL